MFSTKHNECVGFESRWRVTKVSLVESSQTSDYSTKDMETSTSDTRDMEVQTEIQHPRLNPEVDNEKLAAWLKRIYPKVKKELEDNANSRAFKGYKLATDSSDANCKLVQTVNLTPHLKEATVGSNVSALSWNSTNNTLAVSCTYKHNSWCYHEGIVLIYTLNADDNLPESPKLKLTAEACVTNVEFHPILPAIIASGLFSGLIVVWNIQKEEEELIAKVNGHGDGITQLSWVPDINSKNIFLGSSSLDSILSIWKFSAAESTLTLKERHQIRSPLFPKASDLSPQETIRQVIRGITCFDFSKHTPEMFLVGAEGGLVVQCSLIGTNVLPGSSGESPLLDSAYKYYQSHKGEVTSVAFSPNRKDMFMTNGTDLEIRIYMIDQEEPAQVIFLKQQLNYVSWVPYEERLICGCGKSGIIEIFQLINGKAIKNANNDKIKTEVSTRIKINKMKSNIVAVGTENGNIQMWRVPWTLFGNKLH